MASSEKGGSLSLKDWPLAPPLAVTSEPCEKGGGRLGGGRHRAASVGRNN